MPLGDAPNGIEIGHIKCKSRMRRAKFCTKSVDLRGISIGDEWGLTPRWAHRVRAAHGEVCVVLAGHRDRLELADGEDGVSPGQACVFYADDSATSEVWGGGFIAEAVPQVFAA